MMRFSDGMGVKTKDIEEKDIEKKLELRGVYASEILEKIQKGEPVYYESVRIIGDLDISTLGLPTEHVYRTEYQKIIRGLPEESNIVSSSISITSSIFDSNVDFSNTILKNKIDFLGTIFIKEAKFRFTKFEEEVNFLGAIFIQGANFFEATFSKNADFLAAILRGSANFNSVTFKQGVAFIGAIFSGIAYFSAEFNQDAIFRDVEFKTVYFSSATFSQYASFYEAKFIEEARFSESHFRGDTRFEKSHFEGITQFNESIFEKDAIFSGCHFEENTDFSNSNFKGNAGFGKSLFGGLTWFNESIFKKDAVFSGCHFEENTDFSNSNFKGNANFNMIYVEGNIYFNGSLFEGNAEFSRSDFDKIISFARDERRTLFDQNLKLDHCRIYTMHIDAKFGSPFDAGNSSKMHLEHTDLIHLFAHWNSIKDHIQYDGSAYLALIKNYNNLEWVEDADQCYYDYRKLNQKSKNWYDKDKGFAWSKLLDFVSWLSCGYGMRIGFVFGWMIVLIIFSGIVTNYLSGSSGLESAFLSIMAFTTSVPYNASQMNDLRYVFVVERFLGTILISLFVVVLTKKLIR